MGDDKLDAMVQAATDALTKWSGERDYHVHLYDDERTQAVWAILRAAGVPELLTEIDSLRATLAAERAEGERKDAVIEAAQALCEAHYIATSIPSRPQTINRQVWTNLQLALHDYREAQHG